uniref:Heat shock factor protein n=1 Tax=Anopheles albimanus TaxID=7167 RepID=A0A182FTL3_ANOAL
MRGRQDSLDSRFQTMKQENEALWREIAILRQKHHKQQQIVNKLIQFLVTIVQPSRGGLGNMGNSANKRRFQLMINDAPQQAKINKCDFTETASIEELNEALEEVAYANQQELLSNQDKSKKAKALPVITAKIVPSSSSTTVGTGSSTVAGKRNASSAASSASSTIIKTLGGGSVVKKENIAPTGKKVKRNSEILEVSSPMSSLPERSPYRTTTPSVSAGSPTNSIASSVGGGSSGGYGSGNGGADMIEEVFSPAGIKVQRVPERQMQQQQQQRRMGIGAEGRNISSSHNQTPVNLIQLIDSSVNDDDDEDLLESHGEKYSPDEMDQHAYLVDHVDEAADAEIGGSYKDSEGIRISTTTPQAGGSGLRSATGSAAPSMIVTRGGVKRMAIENVRRQNVANAEQQQQQPQQQQQQQQIQQQPQQQNVASPRGSSGGSSSRSNASNSPSPPTPPTGTSYNAESFLNTPVVPGDIFEDSNDQTVKKEGRAEGTKQSPMLGSFSFLDGGYYNPNVNINDVKAALLRQQQNDIQQQQQQQQTIDELLEAGNAEAHGDEENEFDENSLDSSLMLNRATESGSSQQLQSQQQQQQQDQQQQLSKFVSNDLDMSRLNTVAEYGQHIDTVQNDLESLRELLKGEGYQLDANTLLGLFNNNEDMLGYDFPMNLPDMMTDEQQLQQLSGAGSSTSNSNEKSNTCSSPTPGMSVAMQRYG